MHFGITITDKYFLDNSRKISPVVPFSNCITMERLYFQHITIDH